jgi:hypothetical protein
VNNGPGDRAGYCIFPYRTTSGQLGIHHLSLFFHCHPFKSILIVIKDTDTRFVFCDEGFTGGALSGTSTQGSAGSINDVNPTQFGPSWNAGTLHCLIFIISNCIEKRSNNLKKTTKLS